jgi:hypothetical protein
MCYRWDWFPVVDLAMLEHPTMTGVLSLQPGGDWIIRPHKGKTLKSLFRVRSAIKERIEGLYMNLAEQVGHDVLEGIPFEPGVYLSGPSVEHAVANQFVKQACGSLEIHLMAPFRTGKLFDSFLRRGIQLQKESEQHTEFVNQAIFSSRPVYGKSTFCITFITPKKIILDVLVHPVSLSKAMALRSVAAVSPLRVFVGHDNVFFSLDALLSIAHGDIQPIRTNQPEIIAMAIEQGYGMKWRKFETDSALAQLFREKYPDRCDQKPVQFLK